MSDGNILKNLREQSNLSVASLAKLSGVGETTIRDFEKNRVEPSPITLDKLSSILSQFIDLSYVAGLFDRKSSISILKVSNPQKGNNGKGRWSQGPGYIARVQFLTKHKLLINILKKVFNNRGSFTFSKSKGRKYHIYMAWAANAQNALEMLIPYLRLKRKQAELVLSLREAQKGNRGLFFKDKDKFGRLSSEQFEEFVELVHQGYGCTRLSKLFNLPDSTASKYIKQIKDGFLKEVSELRQNNAHAKYAEYLVEAEKLYQEVCRLNKE